MIGKVVGAIVLVALLIYGFTVMNKATDGMEASVTQAVSIQEQLENEGLPPQPAQPPSDVAAPAQQP